LRHSVVENEYRAIAETGLRLLLQFSTSYMCEFGFSAMITIKHKKRERLLSVGDELCVSLLNIRSRIKLLVEITKHTSALKCLLLQTDATGNNKVTRVTSSRGYQATRVYFLFGLQLHLL